MANQWRKIWRAVIHGEGIYGLFTSDLARAIIWPAVVSAMTFLAGILSANPVPLPYLITATALTFAAVATGIVRINTWRLAQSAAGKMTVPDALIIAYGDESRGAYILNTVVVGVHLRNLADFPLYFNVESIRTVFDNKVNMAPAYQSRSGVLDQFSTNGFHDDAISIGIPLGELNRQFMGTLNAQSDTVRGRTYWTSQSRPHTTLRPISIVSQNSLCTSHVR